MSTKIYIHDKEYQRRTYSVQTFVSVNTFKAYINKFVNLNEVVSVKFEIGMAKVHPEDHYVKRIGRYHADKSNKIELTYELTEVHSSKDRITLRLKTHKKHGYFIQELDVVIFKNTDKMILRTVFE